MISGIFDPLYRCVATNRGVLPRYGSVGTPPSFDGIVVTPVDAGGVPAEWVTGPDVDPDRIIIWIHGGGWIAGSSADYRNLSATLARQSGARILVINYRLAPEAPFPAGLNDCVTAVRWVFALANDQKSQGANDGTTVPRIALAGDSAGGNLAAATCVELAAGGHQIPDHLVLIAANLNNETLPTSPGLDDFLTPDALVTALDIYLPSAMDRADPRVSPGLAPIELLARFPPTLIHASALETLLPENKAFAARLEAAGVRVNLSIWPGLPHVWHLFLGLFTEAREALGEIADFTQR